ncbi:MAG: hypothetical protein IJH67_13175 [Thermoguttaceae bacterium]|nr:hypothetical protein [Thermoguttaceae bacterium]
MQNNISENEKTVVIKNLRERIERTRTFINSGNFSQELNQKLESLVRGLENLARDLEAV